MNTCIPHLRVRTGYSFRKAFGSIDAVVSALKASGADFGAIVDTQGTWGHVQFEKAMLKAGLQAGFGYSAAVELPDGRKPVAWCLGITQKGLYNFSSSVPKTEADWIAAAGKVVRFSGCALTDPDAFDYIDLNPSSLTRTKQLLALHEKTGKPLVLTGDNDYPTHDDYGRYLAWVDGRKSTPHHILQQHEWRSAFWWLDDRTFEEAAKNTQELAGRLKGLKLETAPIISVEGDLLKMIMDGKAYRLAAGHIKSWTPEYEQRLQREIEMIKLKAYESYFIVVAELVIWAKKHMLVGPARGSSAGSLVCFLLQITEVDPLLHELLFERFIDVNRNDLPDIDIDFSDKKRHMVFDYLSEKYGKDCVAHIGSINYLKPRSVIAHVGKKLAIPAAATFAVVNVLYDYSSGDSRYGKALADTLEGTKSGQKFMADYPEGKLMGELEMHPSHTGVHAAGIIVSNVPVTNYCTVQDGIAQIDKKDAERLNLLKIDALGLRTLGVIEDAGVITADELYGLRMDDPEVFKVFNDKKFAGIFQFEGAAQRSVTIQIPINNFKQIDHCTALARPGPLGGGAADKYIERNAGKAPVEFRHPSMAEYLSDTMGVVLYQEQVMRISFEIGRMSWEVVSELRRAMSGSKGKEYFQRRGQQFIEGAISIGVEEAVAEMIWDEICSFGAWGMNKCISGETRIKLAHPNQTIGTAPTIKQLYEFYKESPSTWVKQNKLMPKLLCKLPDGTAKPVTALDIIKNGTKPCVKLKFSCGKEVTCTKDHKFIINGSWRPCGEAVIGDAFEVFSRKSHVKKHAIKKGTKGWRKGHKKRHMDFGDWLPPYARGWIVDEPAVLVAVEDAGFVDTYDIEMPAPNHNYILDNGIVTHNSHTTSYAMISYWCAYLKRYFPLEYAAACLRNAKDDEQAVELLRELQKEGIKVIAFDPQKSQLDWAAGDGVLLGGFTNLKGIGPAKAAAWIEKRATEGLSDADLEKIMKHEPKHQDLYPAHTLYGHIYDNPQCMNIRGRVKEFSELDDQEEAVVIGHLVKKTRRDRNEAVLVQKRGGKVFTGQTQFLDLGIVDDSVGKPVTARISERDWDEFGELIADRAVEGVDWFLIRGRWLKDFNMLIVKKIKPLTNTGMLNK